MKPQPRYQPGDRIGGRYQVHKALLGGMGEVYLCLDLQDRLPLALKTFQQRYLTDVQRLRKAFEQEVATWVALEAHPNIVHCFYMANFDRQPFMVLEWVAGEEGRGTDLRGWLQRGPLDLKLALGIIIDICNGLIHAQTKQPGLVHRDLKPENILMAQGGLAKLTDFGLAQIVATAEINMPLEGVTADSRSSMIGVKGIVGTPAYMAPEQWQSKSLDERTDIYALGIILHEVLTGALPFTVGFTPTTPQQWQNWLRTMQAMHESASYPKLPAVFTLAIQELLTGCLSKAATDRPSSLYELLTRLTALYQEQFNQLPPIRPAPGIFDTADYINRGTTYMALGQHAKALDDYHRALALDPNYVSAYYNRGNTYRVLGQHAKALDDYHRALALDSNLAQAYSNRGATYQALGQHTQALDDYSRALALDSNLAQAYSNRGATYQALGQYTQALDNYGRALALDPNDAEIYFNRGTTYHALGKHTQALADYNRAIELDPNLAQVYSNRGLTYHTLGKHTQALADYNRAIGLDPNLAQAYFNRGNTYRVLGQQATALADYTQAITLAPQYAEAYVNIGALLGNQGKLAEALPFFEKATQLGNPQGAQHLARLRHVLGMEPAPQTIPNEEAFDAFQQANSMTMMQQAATRFPSLLQSDFISDLAQAIAQQIPLEQRPDFEQRLAWLRQIATDQKPGFFSRLFNRGGR